VSEIVLQFQELVAELPGWLQPVGVALAGAVPFVEGEGAAAIGVVGGVHPVAAALAAVAGNFLAVLVVVLVGVRTRAAVVGSSHGPRPRSPRWQKFDRAFERYGVAGVSLLGPLLIPTHFTAAALAASGVSRTRILTWQAVAIVLWTTAISLVITGVVAFSR
jgi:uncharacterized membrane protein